MAGHAYVTDVRWRSRSTSFGQCTREGLIAWLSADVANQATVAHGSESVPVLVVCADGQAPYLRAYVDGARTDALLELPRF